ncbi:MAG: PIN domain-containing protein [Candidatus Woesearchaeota archaeon]
MREIFDKQPHLEISSVKNYVLLDTCFFINTFENQKAHKLRELMNFKSVAITSFNVDEFLLIAHSVDERIRENVRRFLKRNNIYILNIDVKPGDRSKEVSFIRNADIGLLNEVSDPSDAVLVAAAILTQSTILTKDKHHLFTTKLENYLNKYKIAVHKEYHDII